MELLPRLQEAVVEIYIKKYRVNADGVSVLFEFEKNTGKNDGVVTVYVSGAVLARASLDFRMAEELVLSERFTVDTLLDGATLSISSTNAIHRGIELLREYLSPVTKESVSGGISKDERDYQSLIKTYISEYDAESISFHPNLVFKKDIVCDELHFIEFIMTLESQFDVDIPDDNLEREITYGELFKIIENG